MIAWGGPDLPWDWIIALEPHVTQGAEGPYGSLRAEYSILRSFSAMGLTSVKHFWPAGLLLPGDYVRLAEDEDMQRAWSNYARENFDIEVP